MKRRPHTFELGPRRSSPGYSRHVTILVAPRALRPGRLWRGSARTATVTAISVTLAALIVGAVWAGWRSHQPPPAPIVYVCTETNETLTAPPEATPAVNPKTGRRTLVRGVYCPECNRWYAAPPPNHRAGNPKPLVCQIHKVPMTYDGPGTGTGTGTGPSVVQSGLK